MGRRPRLPRGRWVLGALWLAAAVTTVSACTSTPGVAPTAGSREVTAAPSAPTPRTSLTVRLPAPPRPPQRPSRPGPAATGPETGETTPARTPGPALPQPRPGRGGTVFLTFDDGPERGDDRLLPLLARHGAHATFFVYGSRARTGRSGLARARAAGHGIANHGWSTTSLTSGDPEQFRRDVHRTQQALGTLGARCVRPHPTAAFAKARRNARAIGYRLVRWSLNARDTTGSERQIATRILGQVRPGSVVLLHAGRSGRDQTVAALRLVLPRLTAAGYRLAPICR